MKNRLLIERRIGALYKRVQETTECVYCGEMSEHWDHRPPLAVAANIDLNAFFKEGGQLLLYRACALCNCKLGGKRIYTRAEATAFLHVAYGREVDKRQKAHDDVKYYGRGLQNIIKLYANEREMYIRKFRGCEEKLLTFDKMQGEGVDSDDELIELEFDGTAPIWQVSKALAALSKYPPLRRKDEYVFGSIARSENIDPHAVLVAYERMRMLKKM